MTSCRHKCKYIQSAPENFTTQLYIYFIFLYELCILYVDFDIFMKHAEYSKYLSINTSVQKAFIENRCLFCWLCIYSIYLSRCTLSADANAFRGTACCNGGRSHASPSYLAYHLKNVMIFHLSISLWNKIFDILSPNLDGVLTWILIFLQT